MPGGTNELRKLRKLERLVRNIVWGDSVRAAEMARDFRGAGGNIFISHAKVRDICRTLDDLEEVRKPT